MLPKTSTTARVTLLCVALQTVPQASDASYGHNTAQARGLLVELRVAEMPKTTRAEQQATSRATIARGPAKRLRAKKWCGRANAPVAPRARAAHTTTCRACKILGVAGDWVAHTAARAKMLLSLGDSAGRRQSHPPVRSSTVGKSNTQHATLTNSR